MKKKYILISICIVIAFVFCFIFNTNTYEKNYFYLDTYINVKITSNKSKRDIDKIFSEIDNIYSEYHILCNKYEEYDDIINIYYLNEVLDNDTKVEIDSKLSDLINEGIKYYDITNGYINIASANLIDIWKYYIDLKGGIPESYELNNANININDILLENNTFTKHNNVKLDLGAFTKGYVTELVGNYLEENNIDKYLIDAGGNIKAGNNYKKDNYVIGVQDPINISEVFIKLNINNLSVVTSGDYQRYYEYNGTRYNHIINPYSKYPSSIYKSVTVVSKDSYLADIYSTYLFLVDIDTGLDIVNSNPLIEAIWYIDSDNIVKSDNIDKLL